MQHEASANAFAALGMGYRLCLFHMVRRTCDLRTWLNHCCCRQDKAIIEHLQLKLLIGGSEDLWTLIGGMRHLARFNTEASFIEGIDAFR